MDPVTLSAVALRAGTELSEHSSLVIAAGQMIYKFATEKSEPKPIKDYKLDPNFQDKTRYERMCNLRRPLSADGKIPEQWELDESSRPKCKVKFKENARQLKKHVDALDGCTYPQKTAVSGMVEIIENVFVALSLKKAQLKEFINYGPNEWLSYRSDSYEAMFFADLAIWLSIDLPRYDIKDTQTEVLIKSWIAYCDNVQKDVLKFRGDEASARSPKELLSCFILELEQLHKNIGKANKAATFNDKIEQINVEMVNMAKHAFNFLHLLIEDEKNPVIAHSGINVRQFLAHSNPKNITKIDPSISQVVKSVMGGWMAETFRFAGIGSCDFVNESEIRINDVSEHINTDFSRIRNLKATGLWGFARGDRQRAEKYLEEIAKINRLILMLYYVRDSVVMGALVSRDLGNSWVYGEDTGKEIVDVLLSVIHDASKKLTDGISEFWQEFYTNHYLVAHNRHDNTDICYKHMNEADEVVAKIIAHHQSIGKKLTEISHESGSYVHDRELMEQKIRKLMESLHAYAVHAKLPVSSSFLSSFSNQASDSRPRVIQRLQYVTVGNDLAAEETGILNYAQEEMPVYCKAVELYDAYKRNQPSAYDFSTPVNSRQTIFHSDVQKRIYYDYLVPGRVAVRGWEFFSFLNGISVYKIVNFKKLYAFVNAVMKKSYSGRREDWLKITKIEAALIDSILIKAIRKDFDEYQYFSYNFQFQEEALEGRIVNGRVVVTLNENWKDIATEVLAKELRALTEESNDREELGLTIQRLEQALEDLTTERDALVVQLREKDAVIVDKDVIIAEQVGLIAEQLGLNKAKDETIQDQESQLALMRQQNNNAILSCNSGRDSFKKSKGFGMKIPNHGLTFLGGSSKAKAIPASSGCAKNDDLTDVSSFKYKV